MGMSLAVGTVAGVPLTIFSSRILGLFGHEMVAFVALALYSVRMLGYSTIRTAGERGRGFVNSRATFRVYQSLGAHCLCSLDGLDSHGRYPFYRRRSLDGQ